MKKIIEAIQDFWKYNIYYKYEDFMYKYFRVPGYKFQLMFKYFKDDYICWSMVESSIKILFAQYIHFFETQKENLMPRVEDGIWKECKFSEGWPGVKPGEGTGVKFQELKDIYMYVKSTRYMNKDSEYQILHLLFSNDSFKSWGIPYTDAKTNERMVLSKDRRLKNFKIYYHYTAHDLLTYHYEELENPVDDFREDIDILHKIEQELIELDNKYAKKIIDIRNYLWW